MGNLSASRVKYVSPKNELLGAFANFPTATISLRHVCPAVFPSAWNNSASTRRILMKFDIRAYFEKKILLRNFNLH